MKNIRISALLVLLVICFTACSSDDSAPAQRSDAELTAAIAGTWNLTEYTSDINYQDFDVNEVESGANYTYSITFDTSTNFITSTGSYEVNGVHTAPLTTFDYMHLVNSNGSQQEGFHLGDWSITNGKLSTTATSDMTMIQELTTNRLTLYINVGDNSSQNATGFRRFVYTK